MGVKDLFNNNYETGENIKEVELQTHYYRNRIDEVIRVCKEMIKSEGGELKAEDQTYQELYFETVKYSAVIILVAVRPTETAVDFKITTYKLIPNGKGKKVIIELYKYLDSKLSFKGLSLFNK